MIREERSSFELDKTRLPDIDELLAEDECLEEPTKGQKFAISTGAYLPKAKKKRKVRLSK